MNPAGAVDFLAGLAGGGRVLELAIGTGRVALPLAGRGIAVEGELDLMAQQASLRLRERYGGWDKHPFDPSSRVHVSVYQRD